MLICLDGKAESSRSVLALGMFDGVHLGHRVLLMRAKALARQQGVPLVVSTFTSHPMQVIRPAQCPPMLTTLDERARKMEALGVDILCAEPFDQAVMDTPPEAFIAELCKQFHPCFVVVGYNHSFGKKGAGNPILLEALGQVFGYMAEVVPKITLDGQEVSSTIIRNLLAAGDVDLARQMLGAPYQLLATVAEKQSGTYGLVMMGNGKQDVPPGRYRALMETLGKRYPVALQVPSKGKGVVQLTRDIPQGSEAILQLYHQQG